MSRINYRSIKVKVIDDQNLSLTQEFEISLLNVIEDRDGDGIEDAYDFDFDNDGIEDAVDSDDDNDGFPDSYEIAYGSDPYNANSVANKFPTALYLNGFQYRGKFAAEYGCWKTGNGRP